MIRKYSLLVLCSALFLIMGSCAAQDSTVKKEKTKTQPQPTQQIGKPAGEAPQGESGTGRNDVIKEEEILSLRGFQPVKVV